MDAQKKKRNEPQGPLCAAYLFPGENFVRGQEIRSNSGKARLIHQKTGDVQALGPNGEVQFTSSTTGQATTHFSFACLALTASAEVATVSYFVGFRVQYSLWNGPQLVRQWYDPVILYETCALGVDDDGRVMFVPPMSVFQRISATVINVGERAEPDHLPPRQREKALHSRSNSNSDTAENNPIGVALLQEQLALANERNQVLLSRLADMGRVVHDQKKRLSQLEMRSPMEYTLEQPSPRDEPHTGRSVHVQTLEANHSPLLSEASLSPQEVWIKINRPEGDEKSHLESATATATATAAAGGNEAPATKPRRRRKRDEERAAKKAAAENNVSPPSDGNCAPDTNTTSKSVAALDDNDNHAITGTGIDNVGASLCANGAPTK